MKQVFAFSAVLFVAMWVWAQSTLPRPPKDNIIRLRWATDPNPVRESQIALFEKMNPGVEVTVDPTSGDPSKIIVQCATGTGPDIMDCGQAPMTSFVEAGILLDLTPYAKGMGFDVSKTYAAIKNAITVEGRQYTFPCNVDARSIIYNKKVFDDHGVPYPKPNWSYAEFLHTCKLLRERPSKSHSKSLVVANSGGLYLDYLMGQGGNFFTPDGLHCAVDSPISQHAMQQYHDLMYVQKAIPTPVEASAMSSQGGWGSGGLNIFSQGQAAMLPIGRWYIVQVPNFPDLKGHLGAVTYPRLTDAPATVACGARGAGINVKSPHWREALLFLKFLASPAYSRNVVEVGDALPPNPKLAPNGKALVNDMVADPAFHQPFIDAIAHGRSPQYSPYIDPQLFSRWISEYTEKVENNILPPKAAMRQLADQVNRQIRVNLERRPDLQKKFEERTGRPYTPDWS